VNKGLLYLLRKRPLARLRWMRRRMGLWKSLAIGAFVVLVVGSMTLPRLLVAFDPAAQAQVAERIANNARMLRALGPLAILMMALLATVAGRGLYFRREEIDFLFPAPVSRRDLLLFNVASRLMVQLLSAAWISIFLFDSFGTVVGGLLGTFLVFAAVQLVAQNASVLTGALGKRLPEPVRWAALLVTLVAVYVGFQSRAASLPAGSSLVEQVEAFVDTPLLIVLSAPTRPFIEIILAPDLASALLPAAMALALTGLLVGSLMAFDVAYLESSLHFSRKVQARLERMRAGGGVFGSAGGGRRFRLRVPRLPRMGGAGPLAWRQLTEITRNLRGLAGMLVAALFFGAVFVGIASVSDGDEAPAALAVSGLAMTFMFVTMMTQNFAFDFRGDLDRLSVLRALPIAPLPLATGQILPAALALTFVQYAVGTLVFIASDAIGVGVFLAYAVLVPPLCYLIIGVDNAVFLVMPYRLVTDDPGNLPFLGRMMFVMGIKGAVLASLSCMAFGVGAGAYYLGGESVVFGAIVAALALVGLAVPMTWAVAVAFQRFDLGKDIPG